MSIGKIMAVAQIAPQRLSIAWDDGYRQQVDLAEVIASHPGLLTLAKSDEFAKARISDDGWAVEWPNDVDFGTDQLRRWADEQAGESMRRQDFCDWLDRHRLRPHDAAKALGIASEIVERYISGEYVIPKTVLLATEGFSHRRAA